MKKTKNETTIDSSDIQDHSECLSVEGAREHNLKNIDVVLPRNKLVVITGLSGSGKSTLAFDIIYAEGQRRYMETLSAYARQYIGNLSRPDVDRVTGLSPVIAIEQKSTSRNPRSTVGTVTEIYDFLRLLFARVADAISYNSGEKMVKFTEPQIVDLIQQRFAGKKINVLSPLVRARKGHYRELIEQQRRSGFLKLRIDGKVTDITAGMQLERYKVHDIELLIDRIQISGTDNKRLKDSVQSALRYGKGGMMVHDEESGEVHHFSRKLMCPTSGISYDEPEPNTFSFNSPYGACSHCNGLGEVSTIDIKKIIPDDRKTIRKGGLAPVGEYKNTWFFKQMEAIGEKHGFTLDTAICDIPEDAMNIILYGSDEVFRLKNEYVGVYSNYTLTFEGIVNFIVNQNDESATAPVKRWAGDFMNRIPCPECNGMRLKKESLNFKILGNNIAEVAMHDINSLLNWVDTLEKELDERKLTIAAGMLKEIRNRAGFLIDVGLDYLSLNRPAKSLSGGEAQRIRLATQVGTQLVNVLYILDEPSIGLHQRDNQRLISSLKQLRDNGNSVIVVEHDRDMILSADYILDMGPGAGFQGGQIVGKGTPAELKKQNTLTAEYLRNEKLIPVPAVRRKGNGKFLEIKGAKGNNLKSVDVEIPLGKMICITGVSGSGKSSLVNETLYPMLSKHFYRSEQRALPHKSIEGIKNIDKVIEVDQSPIGRTPRSNPATYTKVFDEIRKLFSSLPEAKVRGYLPGRFSFNVKGGRCENCQGAGLKVVEMNFLPDVYVNCEVCNGRRYNRETLEVRYKGKSINDVLNMDIDQALEFFESIPHITQKIRTLHDVGLGYITLGQQSTTLSGGESQRVKLAAELSKKDTGNTLYILDEPTTGLHFDDIRVLLDVLNKLTDKGNTVIIIEHNLDVIKVCDHVIDLGPDGGMRGGFVVAEGTPEEISKVKNSLTGKFLKDVL
ncbi:MAG: excinuclease ABC subunit UvrA [Bacteroidota bacterium]